MPRLYRDEFGFNVGDPFLVFFIDNGYPSSGQAGPDIVSLTYIFPYDAEDVDEGPDFPNTCPDAAATVDTFSVLGTFVVKDR